MHIYKLFYVQFGYICYNSIIDVKWDSILLIDPFIILRRIVFCEPIKVLSFHKIGLFYKEIYCIDNIILRYPLFHWEFKVVEVRYHTEEQLGMNRTASMCPEWI